MKQGSWDTVHSALRKAKLVQKETKILRGEIKRIITKHHFEELSTKEKELLLALEKRLNQLNIMKIPLKRKT